MAKQKSAGQELAQAIEKWRGDFLKLHALMNHISCFATERPHKCAVYYPGEDEEGPTKEQQEKLFDALQSSYKAKGAVLRKSAEDFLAFAAELTRSDNAMAERKILAQIELAKLYAKPDYQFAAQELLHNCYLLRRWAIELSWLWDSEKPVIDGKQDRAFANAEETCPWNPTKSEQVLSRLRTELSQLERDAKDHPPLVTSESKAEATPAKKVGRKKQYDDDAIEAINIAYEKFLQEYESDSRKPRFIRKKSLEHFVDWAERNEIDIEAKDSSEAKKMLDAYRKRIPTPAKRKTKTAQKKRKKKTTR